MRWRAELAMAGVALASCTQRPPAPERVISAEPLRRQAAYRPTGFEQVGLASWYGDELRGRRTATGEPFDPDAITAAHPTLALPTHVVLTALDTGRAILVRINDRGPFHGRRILDMSFGAARLLGMTGHGARPVHIAQVDPSPEDAQALRRGMAAHPLPPADQALMAAWRAKVGWTPPPRASRTIPDGAGPLWLQVASFSSRGRAKAMASRLGAQVDPQGAIYRVRLGPYATAAAAQGALAPLGAKGYPDPLIVH